MSQVQQKEVDVKTVIYDVRCKIKLPVPPKAVNAMISVPLISSVLHSSLSVSPQVQNPLSTDNNKGGSILGPSKPIIYLVSKKDMPDSDASISWNSKDYHKASNAYRCKLLLVINL